VQANDAGSSRLVVITFDENDHTYCRKGNTADQEWNVDD